MQGGKESKGDSNTEPQDRVFILTRQASALPSQVMVDFSPSSFSIESGSQSQLPVFLNDGCYFTPGFVLRGEQEKYSLNRTAYQELHEAKVEELTQEKEELLVARPSRSNSFCCICRQSFDDYLTHVNVPHHQNLLRASPFYAPLALLAAHHAPQRRFPPAKAKPITKNKTLRSRPAKQSPLSTAIHPEQSLSPKPRPIEV